VDLGAVQAGPVRLLAAAAAALAHACVLPAALPSAPLAAVVDATALVHSRATEALGALTPLAPEARAAPAVHPVRGTGSLRPEDLLAGARRLRTASK
jgi:hypothetical protein